MYTMKKSIYSLAVALLGSLLVTGCYEDPEELASINKSHVKGSGAVSIVGAAADGESIVYGEVSITSNPELVYEAGLAVSTSEDFAGATVSYSAAAADESGKLTATIKKLKGGTKYYARAYAFGVDGNITYSSNVVSVETEKPDTWTLVGKGTFIYYAYFESEEATDDLELYVSDRDPKKHKLTHFFAVKDKGFDFFFTVNEDNSIEVEEQATTYEYEQDGQSYGLVYVCGLYKAGEKYSKGKYDPEKKTYTFVNWYYVEAGTLGYGNDYFILK